MGAAGQGWGNDDRRAQAIQIGALLLFAILIINLSLYQVFVVPDQNGEIEFKHSQQVQEELTTARSLSTQSVATDSELSTSIRLAPQYPSRALFVNPGPPSGTLKTVDRGNLVLRGVQPLNDETADAWPSEKTFPDRKALVYRPNYNVYASAPTTVYGSSVLYNVGDDGGVRNRTGQTVVSGNRITLLSMGGSMGRTASGSETIEFQPTSAPTRRVPVEPDGTMEVQLETEIPESVWDDLLAGQIDEDGSDPDAYVQSLACSASNVDDPCGTLTLTFEPDATYSLRMGRVGVGNNVQDEPEEYITKVDPTGARVNLTEDGSRELTVEVRDAYNNPVSGVEVTVDEESGGGDVETGPQRTDAEGRATFTYAAEDGETTSGETVEFEIDGGGSGPNSPKEVRYEATVEAAGSSAPGGGADYDLRWEDPAVTESVSGVLAEDCGSVPCPDAFDLAAVTDPSTDGAPVYFGTSNPDMGSIGVGPVRTTAGRAPTTFDPTEPREPGATTLQTFSGGNRDTLPFDVQVADGFEDGALATAWVAVGDNVTVSGEASNTGTSAARIGDVGPGVGGFVLKEPIDTSDADLVVVEYWAQEGVGSAGPDSTEGGNPADEQLGLQYRTAGGSWTTADTVSVQDSPGTQSFRRVRIAAADALGPDFEIRFVQPSSTGEDEWFVDDVSLSVFGTNVSGGTDGSGGTGSNIPPNADATNSDTAVDEGSTADLDGSASSDPDGSITTYEWTISGSVPSGVSISDTDPSTPGATFDASGADVSSDTDVTVELTVTDDDGATDTDTVTVTVRDTDAGGTLAPDEVAYADANGDGTYQDSETAYTQDQLVSFDRGVNLVVAKDVNRPSLSIKADRITTDPGAELSSHNGETKLTATSGPVDIGPPDSGSPSINAPKITIKGESVSLRDGASLTAYNSEAKLTATSGAVDIGDGGSRDSINAPKVTISGDSVSLRDGANVVASNSEAKLTATNGAVDIGASNGGDSINAPKVTISGDSVSLRDGASVIASNSEAKFTATSGPVEVLQTGGSDSNRAISAPKVTILGRSVTLADGSSIDGYNSGVSVKATNAGGGPIVAEGATLTGPGIVFESKGDIDLDRATLEAPGQATSATLNDASRTLFVDELSVSDADDELACSPSDVNVQGTPSQGSVGCGTSGTSPTIDRFTTTQPGNSGKIKIDWTVSDDDGDLNKVRIVVTDSNGNTEPPETFDVSGGSASRDNVEITGLSKGETYDVTLTVSDNDPGTSDTSETKSQQVTDGGNGSQGQGNN